MQDHPPKYRGLDGRDGLFAGRFLPFLRERKLLDSMAEMTTHERVQRMFEHREADRVPITDDLGRERSADGIVKECRRASIGGTILELTK